MIDKKTFKKSVGMTLEKAGLQKRGQSWYLDGKDAIVVTNLQKSDWGDLYYINIGIWLKALGDASFPNENQCHIGFRAESLFPEQRELILISCSLEKSTQQLLAELSDFFERQLIPFISKCTYVNKLRNLMLQGILEKGLVMKEAKWYLSQQ